jgi:nitroreductase
LDTFEAIRRRRSIRSFTGESIPREHIEMIVDAGRLAATGFNHQPWDFIVITGRSDRPVKVQLTGLKMLGL